MTSRTIVITAAFLGILMATSVPVSHALVPFNAATKVMKSCAREGNVTTARVTTAKAVADRPREIRQSDLTIDKTTDGVIVITFKRNIAVKPKGSY